MNKPSTANAPAISAQPKNSTKKQLDKEKKLAEALRQNLLRRKAATKSVAESDDTSSS
jgi:hypothetical protein